VNQILQLGNKSFSSNLIQGPLAGVSCAPFRRLIWQYSQPAFACTEMISCNTLIHQSKFAYQRFVKKDPLEKNLCFQLSGSDAKAIGEATKIATALGADLIDLNCGCPVKKIRSRGAGSSLLTSPTRLFQLITAMKKNTELPVSIKIRVEKENDEKFNAEIAKVVNESGVDFLIVHGRHWTEHYETACRYESIQYFVNAVTVPVVGNGDVACITSLQKMLATGCAGVMLGRAGVGQPWLIEKLQQEMQQKIFAQPSMSEIGKIFIDHIQALSELLNNEKLAILQARKLAKYYARSLQQKNLFCESMNTCDNLETFVTLCVNYFTS
jgi:nifR3 family TIM-barrel protein